MISTSPGWVDFSIREEKWTGSAICAMEANVMEKKARSSEKMRFIDGMFDDLLS